MNAKRHFQDVYGNTYNMPFDSISMVKFAESYHQTKIVADIEKAVSEIVGNKLSKEDRIIPEHYVRVTFEWLKLNKQ